MPTTVNGIGTTYFGKKNLEQYQGVCDSCNRSTTLSDYETGHYICIIFIPLIPIGRKMILGECQACTRHRVVPLREWEQMKEQSISHSMDALTDNAEDPEKAIELLGTYTAFKQYDEARELAAAVKTTHWNHYDTVLAIGGWYEGMEQTAEAEACFAQCLALDPDCPASKRIRCITHLENDQLQEAQKLAYELFSQAPIDNLGPMLMLINSLEQTGQDGVAYEVYKHILQGVPDLKEDKDFCKDIRKLEKKLGASDSIVPKRGWFG